MNNVTFKDLLDPLTDEVTTYAFIEIEDGGFTIMTKANYEQQQAQAEHFTPIVTSDE